MQTLREIRSLLAARGIRPKHRLGQNFLHDQNQIRKLVDAAFAQSRAREQASSADVHATRRTLPHGRGSDPSTIPLILEVGPGTGALTEALLERGADVIACEIDPNMIAILRERLAASPRRALGDDERARLTIIEVDALAGKHEINPQILRAVGGREFTLAANLPYQIATPLMINLLIDVPQCAGQFVTIQKEVADRLHAKPSTKDYGPLSIIAQMFARIELIGIVQPSCFWPEPEVTSAMVALSPSPFQGGTSVSSVEPGEGVGQTVEESLAHRPHTAHHPPPSPLPEREGEFSAQCRTAMSRRAFARFVTNLFTKRRKQLGTIFGRGRALPAGIEPSARPESLSPLQMVSLYESMRDQDN